MGPVVPWEVTMSDLFLAGMAVLRLILGGIKVAGLSADSGVLREMLRSKATITCWAVTHLVPANRFVFGREHISYVFLTF
jgi:hypothetical protein